MFIIWTRKGFLVPVVAFGMLVIMQIIVDAMYGTGSYTASANLYGGLGFVIAGAMLYGIALRLGPNEQSKRLVDPSNNQPVVLKQASTFFFIPIRYWSYTLPAIGVVMMSIYFLS